ncbi:APC membrane recruitment protein 2-like [Hippocampus comes]|uniref:APC membrane recruitment protein 2-like n=1 Tax=Hippocampus comes TaxID=109280 RepID=A0A3Q3DNH5_HIPCM|nr:PREDICTED: APC membrane recruitment protein 2-like [Hippocampus comes]
MDVQMENVDPPPCESQPSGKIRKGFKLFGKRKPGNIFSLKNNKSPVTRSQTLDGLPEGAAPDSELEADKEKAREVSQGDGEHAAEEPTGEDGVPAAARNSISSTGSTKTLRFFSRLRGARRGGGDRKVHTVCQPSTRQRQGLKGLFGSMKLRPKDEEDKVDAPPSPLLMSSRSNSVEIIKEDIGLTPKSQPRSLESPDKASSESSLTQADDANRTEKDAGPVPAAEAPVVPAESSLGSLLDDISSLLTFESISGGDIMADVKAEWSKARCGPSLEAPEVSASATFPSSGPAAACPLTSASCSPAAAGGHSLTYAATSTSSSVATPVVTSLTKSSTLTTGSVKPSSDFSPASEQPSAGITIKSPQSTTNAKLSPSPPTMAAPSIAMKTIPSTTPMNRKSLDRTQESTCNFGDMASSDTATPPVPSPSPTLASVSKPPAVAASHKPATHSLSSPATCTRPDSNFHTSSSAKPQNVAPKVETAPSPVQSHPPLISLPPITATISKPVQTTNQPVSNRISVMPESPRPEPSPTAFTSFSIAKKSPVSLDSTVVALSKELRTTAGQSPVPPLPPVTVSKDPPVPASLVSVTKDPPVAGPTSTTEPPALTHISVSVPKNPPAPVQIQPKSPDLPTASLLTTPPVPLPSDTAASNKMSGNEPSTNGQLSRPSSAEARTVKVEEQHNGSRMDVPKERRTQVRALSKIPVVGGGRVGKQPVRDIQHTDDDSSRDPPTPIEDDGRHLDFRSTGSGDKGCSVEVHVATFKPSQEESQPPHQSKAPAGAPRDSKIPVKHGAQSPPASQTPQAKETPRTKIPVSRVPVRRVANKPATAGAGRK